MIATLTINILSGLTNPRIQKIRRMGHLLLAIRLRTLERTILHATPIQAGALTTYVVPSDTGPHRKYYALHNAGRAQLELSRKVWTEFAGSMQTLLDGTVAA